MVLVNEGSSRGRSLVARRVRQRRGGACRGDVAADTTTTSKVWSFEAVAPGGTAISCHFFS